MNLFQLSENIRSNEAAIEFLRQRGILRALDHPTLFYAQSVSMKWAKLDVKAEVMVLLGVALTF